MGRGPQRGRSQTGVLKPLLSQYTAKVLDIFITTDGKSFHREQDLFMPLMYRKTQGDID